MGRKRFAGWFSVAPAGAWMVLAMIPTVSPWAIICRAYGAFICRCRCANLFPDGLLRRSGTQAERRRGQRRRGSSSSRNRGGDICGLLPPNLRRCPSPGTPIFSTARPNQNGFTIISLIRSKTASICVSSVTTINSTPFSLHKSDFRKSRSCWVEKCSSPPKCFMG